jgi:hypothetical protein
MRLPIPPPVHARVLTVPQLLQRHTTAAASARPTICPPQKHRVYRRRLAFFCNFRRSVLGVMRQSPPAAFRVRASAAKNASRALGSKRFQ